jgi:hypothetical protein
MEASEFRIERKRQLKEFQDTYGSLKSRYSSAVVSALKEPDRSKQCLLIQQVLDANKNVTSFLRSFSSSVDPSTCKADPTLQPRLLSDMETYRREHEDIQQGRDQVSALKHAIERTREKASSIAGLFSWYAVLIAVSVGLLLFIIVFRTGGSISVPAPVPAVGFL